MSSGPSTIELLIRLVFSLGLIIGVLMLAAKFAKKNGGALKLPGFGKKDSTIKVLERHSLTKSASIAVVQIGDRTMVVGITEHGITRLADGAEVDEALGRSDDPDPAVGGTDAIHLDDDQAIVDLAGADIATALARRAATAPATDAGPTSATTADPIDTPGAGRTLPLGTATATLAAPARPPRMSFIEALRELTVRKA